MELRHLQYFIAVAEELHFGKAALRLNMTQPPLSQQIKQLEKEVGVTLLKRTKRVVELSAAGESFLKHSRNAIEEIDKAIEMAQRTARGELGRLVVGFVGSATYEFLPPIIREFREKFPSVKLDLREISSFRQQEELLKGNIDIGILHPPLQHSALHMEKVQSSPCILALPKQHPLTAKQTIDIQDLKNEPIITLSKETWPTLYLEFVNYCEQAGFKPKIVQEATEYQMVIGLVSAGIGVTFVPSSAKKLFNLEVAYRGINQVQLTAEWVIAYRKDNQNPILKHFLDIMNKRQALLQADKENA
ncbi:MULTISPECIES: acetoin biosynthesis transcriptional regulator AlsR [Bacillus]|jgi:DNA-binding transcriptional LysR family regulator|uniref:LysR family transcriptional regulator n=5 Tax=Bacillus TaxID=1386 RepID=A7Z9H2_BACVZ|nr:MULTISPECIES: LysR substrate-binding domain-containing protein [Bacillus]AIW31507.1 LysR family transcriptional regulator [Bacillus subtilis]ARM29433.1 LysR family transcriptional regulator [Bacillus vallismortis]MBL3613131.1 LysR family transcriptional regulator [Bacillus sp. RHFS18]SLB48244.1 LysR-type transcriptional regulator [Mycobacteroides abscessus subsp. massiliense]ABS75648.1 LysR family transcriptional regulator [Bacillus velezensis FZB42]